MSAVYFNSFLNLTWTSYLVVLLIDQTTNRLYFMHHSTKSPSRKAQVQERRQGPHSPAKASSSPAKAFSSPAKSSFRPGSRPSLFTQTTWTRSLKKEENLPLDQPLSFPSHPVSPRASAHRDVIETAAIEPGSSCCCPCSSHKISL